MSRVVGGACLLLLALVGAWAPGAESQTVDLRRAAPADAYLVVYGRHNPERDFQRAYLQEVTETVRKTQLVEKIVQIATKRMAEDDLERAKEVWNEIKQAVDPVDGAALLDAQEVLYAQSMRTTQMPVAQHLVVARLTPEASGSLEKAVQNLLDLANKYTEGKVLRQSDSEGGATITTVPLPPEAPFSPTLARRDDVIVFSSSGEWARRALSMLSGQEGESKFDDPRVKEALAHLPEPEDSIVFYDAKLQFEQMRGMGQFIRQMNKDNDEQAERVAGLLDLLFREAAILDYEVTVEYTEGNLNRSAVYGKLLPGAEEKVLTKVLGGGQPFDQWHRWVPSDALSYSLGTGANLHPLYQRALEVIEERFPEAEEALNKWEEIQDQVDVHLDEDILQSFSGEYVSVTLPPARPSLLAAQDSVTALRCAKPDRILQLLHRLVDHVQQIPAVKAQQLQLKPSEQVEGFEELSANILTAFGIRPVIGFHEGWLMLASNPDALQKVLKARQGEGQTITDAEAFQQFHLEIEGPVRGIRYTNLAASTRQAAMVLRQIGTLLPTLFAMAGAEADAEKLEPAQEVLALLPAVADIVEKFDFLEAQLSVTQEGDAPGSYTRRAVTLVRQAESNQ